MERAECRSGPLTHAYDRQGKGNGGRRVLAESAISLYHHRVRVDPSPRSRATALLEAVGETGGDTLDQLLPLVYDELRQLAHRHLARERVGHTLRTTALVHEAYLRLVDDERVTRRGRGYFFAAAGRAMRRVLIDHARRRNAAKRGGAQSNRSLDEGMAATDPFAAELLDLNDALERLEALNTRHARVVECRYFAGLSVGETAAALGVSPRTVKSDWALARAWLYRTLREDESA